MQNTIDIYAMKNTLNSMKNMKMQYSHTSLAEYYKEYTFPLLVFVPRLLTKAKTTLGTCIFLSTTQCS